MIEVAAFLVWAVALVLVSEWWDSKPSRDQAHQRRPWER